ncbi:MAG: AI-2E family transporter [Clostridia bacterium]|nr:AI-2E family transporter [Clostridia bacterium]
MKKDENRRYVKVGVMLLAVLSLAILLTFALFRLDGIIKMVRTALRIMQPFVYGAVIAYILAPLCGKIEEGLIRLLGEKRRRLCAGLSIFLSVLLFILLIVLLIAIVIPRVFNSIVTIVNSLPGQLRELSRKIDELVAMDEDLQKAWTGITSEIIRRVQNFRNTGLMPIAQRLLSGTATYVSVIFRFLSNLILAIVMTVYLLATRKRIAAQAHLVVRSIFSTKWADRIEGEIHFADQMFNGFFMGKLLDSAIIGILCFLGCVAMRFSSAPLIAVVVGITNIIPFFGPFIGAIPCLLILFLENPLHSLMFLIFILILQQLDGNFIGPRILGNTTGLSGLWVTFAILLFGGLWGITGMIVGVPLFAVIYDVARKLCHKGLRFRGREDLIRNYMAKFHPPLRQPAKAPKE